MKYYFKYLDTDDIGVLLFSIGTGTATAIGIDTATGIGTAAAIGSANGIGTSLFSSEYTFLYIRTLKIQMLINFGSYIELFLHFGCQGIVVQLGGSPGRGVD